MPSEVNYTSVITDIWKRGRRVSPLLLSYKYLHILAGDTFEEWILSRDKCCFVFRNWQISANKRSFWSRNGEVLVHVSACVSCLPIALNEMCGWVSSHRSNCSNVSAFRHTLLSNSNLRLIWQLHKSWWIHTIPGCQIMFEKDSDFLSNTFIPEYCRKKRLLKNTWLNSA